MHVPVLVRRDSKKPNSLLLCSDTQLKNKGVLPVIMQVSLYLLHIHVKASLGRLRLANNNVPEEHPYHWVMQNRAIAAHLLSTDMSNGHKDDQTRSEKDAAHSDIVKSWLAIEYTSYSPGCVHFAETSLELLFVPTMVLFLGYCRGISRLLV